MAPPVCRKAHRYGDDATFRTKNSITIFNIYFLTFIHANKYSQIIFIFLLCTNPGQNSLTLRSPQKYKRRKLYPYNYQLTVISHRQKCRHQRLKAAGIPLQLAPPGGGLRSCSVCELQGGGHQATEETSVLPDVFCLKQHHLVINT